MFAGIVSQYQSACQECAKLFSSIVKKNKIHIDYSSLEIDSHRLNNRKLKSGLDFSGWTQEAEVAHGITEVS